MSYKVIPIPSEITRVVREKLISPQYKSLAANVSIADGYGPCRSCLAVFDQGNENRIYFTYNSHDSRSDLPDPGPVYIHQRACERFESAGIPADLLALPILFEAFGDRCRLLRRERLDASAPDVQIAELFADDEVRFINMRNAEAGCFIATVERSGSIL